MVPAQITTIFKIADAAEWRSDYGVNGEGAYVQLEASSKDEVKEGWRRLIETTRKMTGGNDIDKWV